MMDTERWLEKVEKKSLEVMKRQIFSQYGGLLAAR